MPLILYFLSRAGSEIAGQLLAVSLGWQIYALTGSAADLGLAGLVQFVPGALLTLPAGHAADLWDRRRVTQICLAIQGVTAAWLAWLAYHDALTAGRIFAALVLLGGASAFEGPAAGALLPAIVPPERLPKATALMTATFQVAIIGGPALGGLAYALAPVAPAVLAGSAWLLAALLSGFIALARKPEDEEPPSLDTLFAGFGFIRAHKVVLGLISLDLAAVLLGGATALLPIYARDILQVGPAGLGLLRSAPAVGALVTGLLLARTGIRRRAGPLMFKAVILFGAATALFAVSRSLWLSLAALAAAGAADTVSMVIRGSLIQHATPDAMRGRVTAVNYLFINASNQLGEFESGMAAALLGAVPAALLGGLGTIVVALAWMKLFPMLKSLDRLDE